MTTSATRAKLQRAHSAVVESTIAEIAAYLQAELGQKLTAYIAGIEDPKGVGQWAAGKRVPRAEAEERLRTAYQVFHALVSDDAPHTVRNWFIGLNPQLEDTAPAEVIRDGRFRDVLNAARVYRTGG